MHKDQTKIATTTTNILFQMVFKDFIASESKKKKKKK